MAENSNENDPLLAQKRLFGTLKNLVNKTEDFFCVDDETTEENKTDPAYKFIKNKTSEENKTDPAYKFIKNKTNSTQMKEESFKNVIQNQAVLYCPNCGSSINENDSFCGECGHKLDGIKLDLEKEKKDEKKDEKEENLKEIKKENNSEKPINEESLSSKQESNVNDKNQVNKITTKKHSHNNLPIETLEILKSFFDEQLISESEYNTLRKSALKLLNNSDNDSSNNNESIPSIQSISREKLAELKVLFDQELIDKEEYDLLRRDLLFTK